ncbi:MAG: glycosyltransferase [Planctomycetota bacterium]
MTARSSSSGLDQPIRVLLMASSMHGGGSEHQTALLAKHLDRKRFEVHLYLTHAEGDLMTSLPDDVLIHCPVLLPRSSKVSSPLQWLHHRLPGGRLASQAKSLGNIITQNAIDVVYDRTFHMTLIAGHRSSAVTTPRVSTIVSPPDLALPSVEHRFIEAKRRRLAAAYRKSRCIIAVSDAVADSASRYYELDRHAIQVIRNPVDRDAIRFHASLRELSNMHGDTLLMVCVGRLSREKGQADLLTAFAKWARQNPAGFNKVPTVTLRLVGDGPDRPDLETLWSGLTDQAESFHGHRVQFAGKIHPASDEIARADVLVLPSRFEGLPNVVLEAFALGTPVIATTGGGTRELQGPADQPTLYPANPGDVGSLMRGIEAAIRDRDQWQPRIANAMRLLSNRHDLNQAVQRISDCLIRVARPDDDRN